MFDFVGDPNAEGASTARGPMSVTAEDSSGTHRFVSLMMLIIAPQEAVLDEGSHDVAMGTRSQLELGAQHVDFGFRRTDPVTHALDFRSQGHITVRRNYGESA